MSIEYGRTRDVLKETTKLIDVVRNKKDGTTDVVQLERPDIIKVYHHKDSKKDCQYHNYWIDDKSALYSEKFFGDGYFPLYYNLSRYKSRAHESIAMIGGGVMMMALTIDKMDFETKDVYDIEPLYKEWNENRPCNMPKPENWNWIIGDWRRTIGTKKYDIILFDAENTISDPLKENLTKIGKLLVANWDDEI